MTPTASAGELHDGDLEVPQQTDPAITVAVVAWNGWAWTRRAIAAAVRTASVPIEVVVVDNASDDGTPAGLAAMPGVVVARNGRNAGFGVAANQAVARARAPHVLLLNPDALVAPGWDAALLDALVEHDEVAAAGARLLYPDGRLQEAGAVIWGDGVAEAYGAEDRPDRPEYLFRRRVDHVSAACLLVRRDAFIEAGGFDPAFFPAYWEDVDLALRWKALGLHVLYEPEAVAVHAQAGSTDTARARLLVERNRPVFLERWAASLASRPPRPDRDDPLSMLAMRDVECDARLLVLVDAIPGPDSGDDVAGHPLAAALVGVAGHGRRRVTLVATGARRDPVATSAWRRLGVEVFEDVINPAALVASRRGHLTLLADARAVTPPPPPDLSPPPVWDPILDAVLHTLRREVPVVGPVADSDVGPGEANGGAVPLVERMLRAL